MKEFARILFWTLLLTAPTFAESQLTGLLRHHRSTNFTDSVDQVVLYRFPLGTWGALETGGRLSESTWNLQNFDYKGQFEANAWEFLYGDIRLSQFNDLYESLSNTSVLATIGLRAKIAFFTFRINFGGYQRFNSFNNASLFPLFPQDGTCDYDIAARIEMAFRWSDHWMNRFFIATYEELRVFNLNNPYAQIDFEHSREDRSLTYLAYVRYQLLLGFGRLDEMTIGVGLRWAMGD